MMTDPIAETSGAFEELQTKLVPLWSEIGTGPGGPVQVENSVVVVPSLSIDVDIAPSRLHAYEQRLLFMLYLLRQPYLRVVFVTSMPIDTSIVDYYLATVPGVAFSNARKRLHLISVGDSTGTPLSRKLLDRPHLIRQIRSLISDIDRAHIVPFNTTHLERELAVQLGMPMYGADPAFYAFGTKSGSRQVFAAAGVPYPLGHENLYSESALVQAIRSMRAQRARLGTVIVKLNDAVSGMGNATVHLEGLPKAGSDEELPALMTAVRAMAFEVPTIDYHAYLDHVEKGGAIVEELIEGVDFRSPSAQLRITPLGEVELQATHDQILGGPTGQRYLGARFPAGQEYAWTIMQEAEKVGRYLAHEGVIGRFAVDFVVVRTREGGWMAHAIEINLRKGGTTGPLLSLQYLTDGRYDPHAGVFQTLRGDVKCYVASDHVESPAYRVFTPDMLFDIVTRHRLHYDHASQTGALLHLLGDVGGTGQFGVTMIGDSHADAEARYRHFLEIVDHEAALLHHVSVEGGVPK